MLLFEKFKNRSLATAQFFACAETGCISALFYIQHKRDHKPSALLSIYLAFSIILGSIMLCLDIDIRLQCYAVMALATELLLKASMLYLHEKSKWKLLLGSVQQQHLSHSGYGWWTEQSGFWVLPVAHRATIGPIDGLDLQFSPETTSTDALINSFQRLWSQSKYPIIHLTAKTNVV